MLTKLRPRLTHSTVVAYLALVVALTGTSYAAGLVGSPQIKNNSILSKDVHNHTLKTKDLAPKTLASLKASQGQPVAVAANPGTATDPCTGGQTLVLCGTTSSHWLSDGFGIPGVDVWKDSLGNVHIRGSLTASATVAGAPSVFRLPPGMRPRKLVGFPVVTTASAGASNAHSALLLIYPDDLAPGYVTVFDAESASDNALHLGEIVFRADA